MKDKLVKVMIGLAAVVILAVPMGIMHQSPLAAETEGSEMTENVVLEEASQDYDLVVLQDEAVPLAAAPEHNYGSMVIWVVSLSLIIAIAATYGVWYTVYRKRILALTEALPQAEAEKIREDVTFLHPMKVARTEKEIENRIASSFVK